MLGNANILYLWSREVETWKKSWKEKESNFLSKTKFRSELMARGARHWLWPVLKALTRKLRNYYYVFLLELNILILVDARNRMSPTSTETRSSEQEIIKKLLYTILAAHNVFTPAKRIISALQYKYKKKYNKNLTFTLGF